jgi:hypothetical protein
MNSSNKLECLSVVNLSNLVWYNTLAYRALWVQPLVSMVENVLLNAGAK